MRKPGCGNVNTKTIPEKTAARASETSGCRPPAGSASEARPTSRIRPVIEGMPVLWICH